jgi:hypothetical protein
MTHASARRAAPEPFTPPALATEPGSAPGGDVMLLEWGPEGGSNRIEDGIDTVVFRDGVIRVPTVRYTSQPAR